LFCTLKPIVLEPKTIGFAKASVNACQPSGCETSAYKRLATRPLKHLLIIIFSDLSIKSIIFAKDFHCLCNTFYESQKDLIAQGKGYTTNINNRRK